METQGRSRITPARAGITRRIRRQGKILQDHPRSRGNYGSLFFSGFRRAGSPPLARELLYDMFDAAKHVRITPARAGITCIYPALPLWLRDHPRSRGNYPTDAKTPLDEAGSPPLARELLHAMNKRTHLLGITPARAGITFSDTVFEQTRQDHPRSRGNYNSGLLPHVQAGGSPPLARELLHIVRLLAKCVGITPARAGITQLTRRRHSTRQDHPRSRGNYRHFRGQTISHEDHPRSRGNYYDARVGGDYVVGSPPLARELPVICQLLRVYWGITPARAGITENLHDGIPRHWDHPRSRGNYICYLSALSPQTGSPPLARELLRVF